MNRHDLLFLNKEGTQFLFDSAQELSLEPDFLAHFFDHSKRFQIPLIVAAQLEQQDAKIEAGLSFPVIDDGARLRRRISLPLKYIADIKTPYAVVKEYGSYLPEKQRDILDKLLWISNKKSVILGVFGSTALAMITGFSYLHDHSDLDFIVQGKLTMNELLDYCNQISELKKAAKIRFDGEYFVPGLGSIKLDELAKNTKSLVVKGLWGPNLLMRAQLPDFINNQKVEGETIWM